MLMSGCQAMRKGKFHQFAGSHNSDLLPQPSQWYFLPQVLKQLLPGLPAEFTGGNCACSILPGARPWLTCPSSAVVIQTLPDLQSEMNLTKLSVSIHHSVCFSHNEDSTTFTKGDIQTEPGDTRLLCGRRDSSLHLQMLRLPSVALPLDFCIGNKISWDTYSYGTVLPLRWKITHST